jgi:hypothetical protein
MLLAAFCPPGAFSSPGAVPAIAAPEGVKAALTTSPLLDVGPELEAPLKVLALQAAKDKTTKEAQTLMITKSS